MTSGAVLTADTLAAFIALVRQHTGIAMTDRKSVLLERRLRPRLHALALDNYPEYLAMVQRGGAEVPHFIDLVTTNDTLFFRTPAVWTYLSEQFLPVWQRRHPEGCLRIWSAAAASGEELYSMTMLCEEFRLRHPAFRYRLLATDISQQMLALAQAGRYGGRTLERLQASHPQLYKKYFSVEGNGARIDGSLRRHVSFAQHNLLQALLPPQQFDLVLLRNVLIYFDAAHQQTVLKQARLSMHADARLIVGESESINRLNTGYQFESALVYSLKEELS